MITYIDTAYQRLQNQHIAQRGLERPSDVVRWLGAVQAQVYPAGLWAVGLRIPDATEAEIEHALADRTIVRTWPMRGTLHFVASEDVRWMLKLLTPRILEGHANRLLKQYDLDDDIFARSREAFTKALQGGKQLSRGAMYKVLDEAGISSASQSGLQVLWWLAQEGLICFATRQGKQPTFALLDEWVPTGKSLERDEALAELTRRYFTSHGPATLPDYVWWSGLTVSSARRGLEMVRAELIQDVVGGEACWMSSSYSPIARDPSPTAYLLPAYDEYTVGYRDRSAVLNRVHAGCVTGSILNPVIVVDGQVVGLWKRALKKDLITITLQPFLSLSEAEHAAIAVAADAYSRFVGVSFILK